MWAQGLHSHLKAELRKDLLTHMVGGRIPFLSQYWTEGYISLLAISWRASLGPCCVGLCNIAACFIKACKPRKWLRKSASKVEVTVFCNLVTVLTFYLFLLILFIRKQVTSSCLPSWVRNSTGHEYHEMRIIGGHFRSLPTKTFHVHLWKRESIMVIECILSTRCGWY